MHRENHFAMTKSELKKQFLEVARQRYDEREAQAMFRLYVSDKLGIPTYKFAMELEDEIATPDDFARDLQRIQNGEPIQYIIGKTEFYNVEIKVDDSVLIPRPETEELVDWIVKEHNGHHPKAILDIGTGSGSIAIALKKCFPQAAVSGIDISEQALQTARYNAIANRTEVAFYQSDILETNQLPGKYDLIVSNPPYIPESERQHLERNVVDFEPSCALFVPDESPLIFYDKIAQLAVSALNSGGGLYFETHEHFHPELKQLLERMGFTNIVCRNDFRGLPRFICGKKW